VVPLDEGDESPFVGLLQARPRRGRVPGSYSPRELRALAASQRTPSPLVGMGRENYRRAGGGRPPCGSLTSNVVFVPAPRA
jgi:hypothetical protein